MSDHLSVETEEQRKERMRLAERAHDWLDNAAEMHAKQIEAFAVLTIRSLILVAIGGIAAVLGFYSANYERLSGVSGMLGHVNEMLVYLFASLVLTLLTSAFAYFSQLAYASAFFEYDRSYIHPFSSPKPISKRYTIAGDFCRWGAVILAFISLACLVAAGFSFFRIV